MTGVGGGSWQRRFPHQRIHLGTYETAVCAAFFGDGGQVCFLGRTYANFLAVRASSALVGLALIPHAVLHLYRQLDKMMEMRRLNDSIKDETISRQIDRLEEVSGKIFDCVKADPKKLPQIRKFMNYYLPTTLKLLNAYDRMSSQGVEGQNISGTMERVESMMSTIVTAFERQLDSLFGDQALDISTDITVLENMMAREGLSDDPIHQTQKETPAAEEREDDNGIQLEL